MTKEPLYIEKKILRHRIQFVPSTHSYFNVISKGAGEKKIPLKSVTSIIKDDSGGLQYYAADCALDYLGITKEDKYDTREAARKAHYYYTMIKACFGTIAHHVLESMVRDKDLNEQVIQKEKDAMFRYIREITTDSDEISKEGIDVSVTRYIRGVQTTLDLFFKDKKVESIESEVMLFSSDLMLAGQTDLIARIDGRLTLIDLKTSTEKTDKFSVGDTVDIPKNRLRKSEKLKAEYTHTDIFPTIRYNHMLQAQIYAWMYNEIAYKEKRDIAEMVGVLSIDPEKENYLYKEEVPKLKEGSIRMLMEVQNIKKLFDDYKYDVGTE